MASACAGVKPAGLQRLAQVHAVDELHQQVEEAAGLAEVVDGDDVRVAEAGERLGLAVEALGEARVVGSVRGRGS